MRKISLFLYLGLAVVSGRAEAGRFPDKLAYRIYVGGQYAGRSSIEFEEKEGVYTFKATSEVRAGVYHQRLESYTEYSKETLAPKYYSYRGEKVGQEISGVIEFTEEIIKGDLALDGTPLPSEQPSKGQIILFEHYIVEHQTVMLATLAAATEPFIRFHMFFPSDFVQARTTAVIESEVELPLKPEPAACSKYAISLQSADPFFGYFDPDRQAAVYMDYPEARVEIFLESAWGENPPTKYLPFTTEGQDSE